MLPNSVPFTCTLRNFDPHPRTSSRGQLATAARSLRRNSSTLASSGTRRARVLTLVVMLGNLLTRADSLTPTHPGRDGRSADGLVRLLCLLWLAGVAMRMTLLVMPPVIPQVHDELRISETQVGLLIGLPLAMLAVAAIPGSLLIARVGTTLAVTLGMIVAAVGGAARAAAVP